MKIIATIEDDVVIQSILQHNGLWKELPARGPLIKKPPPEPAEPNLDQNFFERECA